MALEGDDGEEELPPDEPEVEDPEADPERGGKQRRHLGAAKASWTSQAEAWRCHAQPHLVSPAIAGCRSWRRPWA